MCGVVDKIKRGKNVIFLSKNSTNKKFVIYLQFQNRRKRKSFNRVVCLIKKFFNKMKKTLLTLGAVALLTLGMASCGSTDCTCKVEVGDEITTDATAISVSDYDGECDDTDIWKQFPSSWLSEDGTAIADGVIFECSEE